MDSSIGKLRRLVTRACNDFTIKKSSTIGFMLAYGLAICLILPLFFSIPSNFRLNQFYILANDLSYNTLRPSEMFQSFRSYYSLGINNLLSLTLPVPDYTQPVEFLNYIWKRLPSLAIVYPTEGYYYYRLKIPNKIIAGNIRFSDIENGILHFGYFDMDNPHATSTKNWAGDITAHDGLAIKRESGHEYKISYLGKTVTFILNDSNQQLPKNLKLLADEQFISQIVDESGIRFVLIFNNKTSAFYFIANPDENIGDELTDLGNNYRLGKNTDFVFYQGPQRLLLVGIARQNVAKNNYFDGPFDQVPPHLNLRAKLYLAYPQSRLRYGGLDPNGNYIEKSNTRVAITPYYQYSNYTDLIKHNLRCSSQKDDSKFWTCLTHF